MSRKEVKLMGILNVTPDSFYDGGKYRKVDAALRQAEKMVEEGAEFLDVGGESSRPGSSRITLQEELSRVVPVVRLLSKRFPKLTVSVDTWKSEVAYQSLSQGAGMINDISALTGDPKMIHVLREFKPQIVLMHMRGNPRTMQKHPRYGNVVDEVKAFLAGRIRYLTRCGLSKTKIIADPGIGFGKTLTHNLTLLKNIRAFLSLRCPVLIGCSRKSFIGSVLERSAGFLLPRERLEGSLAAACWSVLQGASILRVHDVGATRKAIRVVEAIRS